jgi:hypothetical protein
LKKRCITDAAYKNQKPRTSFPKSEEPGWTPGSSAFLFRLSLIVLSFPTIASEFRKGGFKHEVTPMFVALVSQCVMRSDVPQGTTMRLLTTKSPAHLAAGLFASTSGLT